MKILLPGKIVYTDLNCCKIIVKPFDLLRFIKENIIIPQYQR